MRRGEWRDSSVREGSQGSREKDRGREDRRTFHQARDRHQYQQPYRRPHPYDRPRPHPSDRSDRYKRPRPPSPHIDHRKHRKTTGASLSSPAGGGWGPGEGSGRGKEEERGSGRGRGEESGRSKDLRGSELDEENMRFVAPLPEIYYGNDKVPTSEFHHNALILHLSLIVANLWN